eukprot:g1339.t1
MSGEVESVGENVSDEMGLETMGSRKWRYERPRKQDLGNRGNVGEHLWSKVQVAVENTKTDAKKRTVLKHLEHAYIAKKFSIKSRKDEKWKGVDVLKARRVRSSSLYGKGKAPLSAPIEDFDVIGFGVVMYFKFLKYAIKTFALMSIFAVVIAIICSEGSHLNDNKEIDSPNFFSTFSLGNLGSNMESDLLIDGTAFDFNRCGENYDTFDANGTRTGTAILECDDEARQPLMVFSFLDFEPWQSPLWDVAWFITLLDAAYSVLFLYLFVRIPIYLKKLQHVLDLGYLSASDYAVYVSGLPEDFGPNDMEALRKHFSDLYDPTKVQSYTFKSRKCCVPSRRAVSRKAEEKYKSLRRTKLFRPVQCDLQKHVKSRDSDQHACKYVGGWVTDLTLCLHNGDAIRRYKSHLSLIKDAQLASNMVLKYDTGSKFANRKKRKKWEDKFIIIEDKVTQKLPPLLSKPASRRVRSQNAYVDEQSKVCGAFVLFEHQESQRRCIEDYKYFATSITKYQMPEPLKFKGKRISVKRAPEPSTIIWENLEATKCQKLWRRCLTNFAAVALLLISLMCITIVTSASLSKKKPELHFCGNPIMATYYRPRSLDENGIYDFGAMFRDYAPDDWVNLNKSYGYDPIRPGTEDVDRCPENYFELSVKKAMRKKTRMTLSTTEYVYVASTSDAVIGIGETNLGYVNRVSAYARVDAAEYATHVYTVEEHEIIDIDLPSRSKETRSVTHRTIEGLASNGTRIRVTSESSPVAAQWPSRKCREDVGLANSPWLYGSDCDDVDHWVYDLDAVDEDERCFQPCFNPLNDDAICDTYACTGADPAIGQQCETFWAGTIPGCFCRDLQSEKLAGVSSGDVLGYLNALWELYDEYPICTAFGDVFSIGLDVFKVCIVAIINIIMTFLLCVLAEYELHDSLSQKLSSIMLKDFVARLTNTAFVVLLVQANGIPGSQLKDPGYSTKKRDESTTSLFSSVYLFEGSLDGFDVEWYGKMAFALSFQMVVNLVEPHLASIFQWFFFNVQRAFALAFVSAQYQLDNIYRGSPFFIHLRYSHVLHTIFFTMIYGAALPLIVPICALNLLLTYALDKTMLLRFFNTDDLDGLNGSLALSAARSLPYALILHLAFAIWIYSDANVFYSNMWATVEPAVLMWPEIGEANSTTTILGIEIARKSYDVWLASYEEEWSGWFLENHFRMIPRAIRWNVFPIFVLLVLTILYILYDSVLRPVVDSVLTNIYRTVTNQCCSFMRFSSAKVHPAKTSRQDRKSSRNRQRLEMRAKRQLDRLKREYARDNKSSDADAIERAMKYSLHRPPPAATKESCEGEAVEEKTVLEDSDAQNRTDRIEGESKSDEATRESQKLRAQALRAAGDADNDGDVDAFDLHYLEWRALLNEFYATYQQSKVPDVDDVLQRFRGREVQLFEALEEKYPHVPWGAFSRRARLLYAKEMKELESIVFTSDTVFEPPYTSSCLQPVRLANELDFRRHLLNKFGDDLGGWIRSEKGDPLKTGLVYYHQKWDSGGTIFGFAHQAESVKKTWEVIHGYAPFSYDMQECARYHDIIDLCTLHLTKATDTRRFIEGFARQMSFKDPENNKDSGGSGKVADAEKDGAEDLRGGGRRERACGRPE